MADFPLINTDTANLQSFPSDKVRTEFEHPSLPLTIVLSDLT